MSSPIIPEDFLSLNSSSRAITRAQTATWNYVTTIRKATTVTHSCVGCFTGPRNLNLIICKGSLVEIYHVINNALNPIIEFPLVEKVVFMELYHQPPATATATATEHFLFIATELYKFCVLRWDAQSSTLITIRTGGTICPQSGTVVLYSSQNVMRVITNVNSEELQSKSQRSTVPRTILDMKFLYGHANPTVALLGKRNGVFHVKVLEVVDKKLIVKPWSLPEARQPTLLIPVHEDPYGFIIVGEECFVHVTEAAIKTKHLGFFNIRAYGRFYSDAKKQSYLLGDHNGNLLMLELPKLTQKMLGTTSSPSSISCLSDTIVFVGSSSADSQLIKINPLADLQLLSTYANSGPITDFSLINKSGARRKILMCCGTHEKSVLEVFSTGTGINPQISMKSPQILNVWSLKSYTLDVNDTYLVIQTIDYVITVYILAEGGFRAHKMSGFASGVITLCCFAVNHKQLIQVTKESVRLINSKTGNLKITWSTESDITCASATASQILLASGHRLTYLEIQDGELTEGNQVQLENYVACVDISPLGQSRHVAAVGTWNENEVLVFSLPQLALVSQEQITCLPQCILLCAFGAASYLLCTSGDGTLCTFRLNMENFQLEDKNYVSLGCSSRTLRKFLSNGEVYVFFSADDIPSIIFLKNEKLEYRALNLTNVADSCPFHSELTGESVVIGTKDSIVFCTIGEIAEPGKIPMAFYGRTICHQKETQSYAIIAEEKRQMGRYHILLLDENLNTSSAFKLEENEVGLCIVNCRFTGDDHSYYFVGTSYVVPEEDNQTKGRILAFITLNGKLFCIFDHLTNGAVHNLKNLRGGLLANISDKAPCFYELRINNDDTREFIENPLRVEGGGAEERFSRMYTLSQQVKYDLQDIVIAPENRRKHTAIVLMENEVMFASDAHNIIKSYSKVNKKEVGRWYSGEFITQIKMGTLSRLSDEDYAQVPSVIFSTTRGSIGAIVSLPSTVYTYLEDLERQMRLARQGRSGFVELNAHECIELNNSRAEHFIDGDFLESFLTITEEEQIAIAGRMTVSVQTLKQIFKYLILFH